MHVREPEIKDAHGFGVLVLKRSHTHLSSNFINQLHQAPEGVLLIDRSGLRHGNRSFEETAGVKAP